MTKNLIIFTVAFGCFATLSSCGDKKADAPNPALAAVPVNIYELHPEEASYYDQFPGTVVALAQVDLRPVTDGYVKEIYFKEGEMVHKGQKLYEIDRSKYQATSNSAEANIKVAEANLDLAQKDADRYTYLNDHDAVAKQTLDKALTTLQNAKNQLAAARQDAARSQTDLNYTLVKAPFDGVIGISQVRVGSAVAAGQTILNTISTQDPMAVDFVANEKQIPRFVRLKDSKTQLADSTFTIVLPDNSIYNYPAQIYAIDRGVNTQTGTITVRLTMPNGSSVLKAGMSCNVRVRNQDTTAQLMIPGKAVVEQMGEYFVYVAKDTTIQAPVAPGKTAEPAVSAMHAIQHKVQLGRQLGNRVIVRSGLSEGDKIIVDGVQKLHDGSVVALPKKQ